MGCIADLVFYATAACMFAQVNYELTEREKGGTLGAPRGGGQAMTAPNCVEINQCVGCTRQFNTKSFLGNDAADLARSSGEETASPRHNFDFHTGRQPEERPLGPPELPRPVWKSNLRRVCHPPRHRRDACSMAWRCRFLAARPSQDSRAIAVR